MSHPLRNTRSHPAPSVRSRLEGGAPWPAYASAVGVAVVVAVAANRIAPGVPLAALIALGLAGVALLVLALKRFDLFVLLMLSTRPLVDAVGSGSAASPSTLLGLVFLATGALWLYGHWRAGRMVTWSYAVVGLTLITFAAAISCLVSERPIVSGMATAKLAAAVLMFVVLEQMLRTGVLSVSQVMTSVAVSAVIVGTLALGQAVTGTGFYDADVGLKRVYLPFVHPNVLAKYLDIVLLGAIGYALLGPRRLRPWMIGGSLLLGGALLFTYARVGWATVAAASLYLLWQWNRKVVPLALTLGAVVAASVPAVYGRIAELWLAEPPAPGVPANSLEWRIEYWQHLIPMARLSPVNGLGYNMIQLVGGQDLYAHNVWVQTYVEMGVVGIICLVAAIIGIAVTIRQALADTPTGRQTPEIHIAAAVGISLFIMMQTENLLSENTTLWYAAAMMCCGLIPGGSAATVGARPVVPPAATATGQSVTPTTEESRP